MHDDIGDKATAAIAASDAPCDYLRGIEDGGQCRLQGAAITKLRLIAINDQYSAGYRAGYFQRDR